MKHYRTTCFWPAPEADMQANRARVFVCAILCLAAQAHSQVTPTEAPSTATPAAIPLEEVAPRAQEVVGLLRDVEDDLQAKPEIEDIRKQLPEWIARVDELQA